MRSLKISTFFFIALFIVACGGEEATTASEKRQEAAEKEAAKTCIYSYDSTVKTTVGWTAFKTMAKVGVKGNFPNIKITGATASESIATLLENVTIEIPVAGTITGDPARDKKIVEFFFGEMADTEMITGVVKSSEGTNTRGFCMLAVTLNDVEAEVKMRYNVTGSFLKLEGILNLDDHKAEAAVANLNKNCDAKHTGEDGVSKLWSEVELRFDTQLKKECK